MNFILHMDIDAFFPSAVQIMNPNLKNKPVVIGSGSSRSVISSSSYQARKYGVFAGMPTFKVRQLCPDAIFVKPDFGLFSALSAQIFEYIITNICSKVEIASIDECYILINQFASNRNDAIKFGKKLQTTIQKQFQLNVSVGLANTKFLAKMATDFNKPLGISTL